MSVTEDKKSIQGITLKTAPVCVCVCVCEAVLSLCS